MARGLANLKRVARHSAVKLIRFRGESTKPDQLQAKARSGAKARIEVSTIAAISVGGSGQPSKHSPPVYDAHIWQGSPAYKQPTDAVIAGQQDSSIAVGDRYVIAGNNGGYAVFDKHAAMALKGKYKVSSLFSEFLTGGGAANVNKAIAAAISSPIPCDPEHPENAVDGDGDVKNTPIPGVVNGKDGAGDTIKLPSSSCVNEVYDVRVSYAHGRFWIVAAARNKIWTTSCDMDKSSDKLKCAAINDLATRYTFVAVSKTENPTGEYYTYNVMKEYADWPMFAVSGNYALVHHRVGGKLHILDAQKLMQGQMEELRAVSASALPATHIRVPKHFPDSSGATLILSASGNDLWISGISPTQTKPFLGAAQYSEPDGKPFSLSEAAYRDGHIYLVGHDGTFEKTVADKSAFVYLWRIPVGLSPDKTSITIDSEKAKRWVIVDSGIVFRDSPTVEVNMHGDVVIGYRTYGAGIPNQARVSVFYHDEAAPRASQPLRTPSGTGPGHQSLDFQSSALDPDRLTVWTAMRDKDGFVLGRVQP